MRKFYAIASSEAEAVLNCATGKYTSQPFWPERDTLVPIFERVRNENPELVGLKIYVVKVGG
jgi:hypothetical protein